MRVQRGVAGLVAAVAVACAAPRMGGSPGGVEPAAPRYFINPGTLPPLDGFSHAVKVGSVIYVSAEPPVDSTGVLVGAGDLQAQARQAFLNVLFVLHLAGAVPGDVSKLTIYVAGLKAGDEAKIHAAAEGLFPPNHRPAGVIFGVAALPREGQLVAVDAIAIQRALYQPREGE